MSEFLVLNVVPFSGTLFIEVPDYEAFDSLC